MVHRLEIGYPTDAAAAFAPIGARMIKSFRITPTLAQQPNGQERRPPALSRASRR